MTSLDKGANETPFSYCNVGASAQAQMIADLIAHSARPKGSTAPYVLAEVEGRSPYAEIARALECLQFYKTFGNSPEVMRAEYEAYEDSSTFLLMVDCRKLTPVGVTRLIRPNMAGFKSANDIASEKSKTSTGQPATLLTVKEAMAAVGARDPNKTLDVATIAAHPDYTGAALGRPVVFISLIRGIYEYSQRMHGENAYGSLIAIIDGRPLSLLRRVGLPIQTSDRVAAPFNYLGAKGNTFIGISVAEVERSVFGVGNLNGECDMNLSGVGIAGSDNNAEPARRLPTQGKAPRRG